MFDTVFLKKKKKLCTHTLCALILMCRLSLEIQRLVTVWGGKRETWNQEWEGNFPFIAFLFYCLSYF